MFQITDMPEELMIGLLSEWLTIDEIAYLDNAFCNKECRTAFLNAAYKPGVLLQCAGEIFHCDIDFYDAMNMWIIAKNASVDGFWTTESFWESHSCRRDYLTKRGVFIRWVVYPQDSVAAKAEEEGSLDYSSVIQSAVDVATNCPALTRFVSKYGLDSSISKAIAEHCPLLEELSLRGSACDSKGIAAIADGCRNLKHVTLVNFIDLQEQSLISLVRRNRGLLSINLFLACATGAFLRELAINCPELRQVELHSDALDLSAIHFLLQHCLNLTRLGMNYCHFTPAITALRPGTSASMQRLDLTGMEVSKSEIEGLLRACPGLTIIQLIYFETPLDMGGLRVGTLCPRLQCLDLTGEVSIGGDAMLLDIAGHCHDLRDLVCAKATVTDTGLCAVARECAQLRKVSVGASNGVTDNFLTTLAKHCHHLADLTVGNCAGVTLAGYETVLRCCSHLTELSLHKDVAAVQGDWERRVKERYPHLRHVYQSSW